LVGFSNAYRHLPNETQLKSFLLAVKQNSSLRNSESRNRCLVARIVSHRGPSAPNPKFARIVLQKRLRTSGSKGALDL
jgi:hypothetical protein